MQKYIVMIMLSFGSVFCNMQVFWVEKVEQKLKVIIPILVDSNNYIPTKTSPLLLDHASNLIEVNGSKRDELAREHRILGTTYAYDERREEEGSSFEDISLGNIKLSSSEKTQIRIIYFCGLTEARTKKYVVYNIKLEPDRKTFTLASIEQFTIYYNGSDYIYARTKTDKLKLADFHSFGEILGTLLSGAVDRDPSHINTDLLKNGGSQLSDLALFSKGGIQVPTEKRDAFISGLRKAMGIPEETPQVSDSKSSSVSKGQSSLASRARKALPSMFTRTARVG